LAIGQVTLPPGTHIATYANINVAPTQSASAKQSSVNFYLATPQYDSNGPKNMTVKITDPTGYVRTMVHTQVTQLVEHSSTLFRQSGRMEIQMFYGGQVTAGSAGFGGWPANNAGLIEDPSESDVFTLIVQEEPIVQTGYPLTPLPTSYWETPVSAQNVNYWYKIMGPWLGLGSITFASTGAYNVSSLCNPYTQSVTSGHIIWTKLGARACVSVEAQAELKIRVTIGQQDNTGLNMHQSS
jgi:hypothetical protein